MKIYYLRNLITCDVTREQPKRVSDMLDVYH